MTNKSPSTFNVVLLTGALGGALGAGLTLSHGDPLSRVVAVAAVSAAAASALVWIIRAFFLRT